MARCRLAGRASAMPTTATVSTVASGARARSPRLTRALRPCWPNQAARSRARSAQVGCGCAWAMAYQIPESTANRPSCRVRVRKGMAVMSAEVVGGDQQGHPDLMEAAEQLHDLPGQVRVQVAGGLVGDDDRGAADHGAGDAHPLLLAPGERRGQAALLAQEPDLIQGGAHPPPDLACGPCWSPPGAGRRCRRRCGPGAGGGPGRSCPARAGSRGSGGGACRRDRAR